MSRALDAERPLPASDLESSHFTEALVFLGVSDGLQLQPVMTSPPGPDEVTIEVSACGACRSDVHKLEGHGSVDPPCIFGHEISGVVTALGSNVRNLAVGNRVVCSFLAPCGSCEGCQSGREDDCRAFRNQMQVQGLRFDGTARFTDQDGETIRASGIAGLARHVTLPRTAVFALPADWPEAIPLTDAAVLGCAGLTAYGAVTRAARLRADETVAVIAAGGVGLCVIALAKYFGARRIVAFDVRDDALEMARQFGATEVIRSDNAEHMAMVGDITADQGFNVVFDTIGLPVTVSQALSLAGLGGRVVITGLGSADAALTIPDPNQFVRRKLSLIGSYAAVPSVDMPGLLTAVASGAMNPTELISIRYPFEAAADAFEAVKQGQIIGRALIEF